MKGIFVNWTKPFEQRNKLKGHAFKIYKNTNSDQYYQSDLELLYTILSVGNWKKFNGSTKLYTDNIGLEYYKQTNLIELFDEVDIDTLNNYTEVDGGQFWTSGKSYCIGVEQTPFCFLDLDFIIQEKLPEWVFNSEITIAHWEIPRGYYYPNKEQFKDIKHWQPPSDFAYRMLIPNTSFLYINNKQVQEDYLRTHLEAVNTQDEIPEWFWLLTDQGLLGQTLRRLNVKPETLTDRVFLADSEGHNTIGNSDLFYYPVAHDSSKDQIKWWHIWFNKIYYNSTEEIRIRTCQDLVIEIKMTLPEFKYLIDNSHLKVYDI